jgi:hypothetical protein
VGWARKVAGTGKTINEIKISVLKPAGMSSRLRVRVDGEGHNEIDIKK